MKPVFTLHEAVYSRGPCVKHDPHKPARRCTICFGDCNVYNYGTWFHRESLRHGLAATPLCSECCGKMEYWRDRLTPEVPREQWKSISILPPCDYIRDIEREDAERQSAGGGQ